MRKFKFRLEKVLKLRKQVQRQKELEFQQAARRLADYTATGQALREIAIGYKHAASGASGVDARSAMQLLQLADEQLARIRALLPEVFTQKEQVLEALVAATRAKKLLEKLREHKLERFQREYGRALQRELDESGLLARRARAASSLWK